MSVVSRLLRYGCTNITEKVYAKLLPEPLTAEVKSYITHSCLTNCHKLFILLYMESTQENEIIIYRPDETLKLDVHVEGDTMWLTQAKMVELFHTTK